MYDYTDLKICCVITLNWEFYTISIRMRCLLSLLLLFYTLFGYAQLERGTWLLAGSQSNVGAPPPLVTGGVIGGVFGTDLENFFGIRMSPTLGVAVTNALVLGGSVGATNNWFDGGQAGQFALTTFGRYYLGNEQSALLPFGEARFGYERFGSGGNASDQFNYQLGVGGAYRLNAQITLEGLLAYRDDAISSVNGSDQIRLSIGLSSFLQPANRTDGAAAAPYGAGSWILGATGLDYVRRSFSGVGLTRFSLLPSAQYLLTDQFALGGTVGVDISRSNQPQTFRSTALTIGPTARYYFGAPRRQPFFVTAGVLYAYTKSVDFFRFGSSFPDPTLEPLEFSSNELLFGFGLGQQLFLTDKLALEYGPRIQFRQTLDDFRTADSNFVRLNLEIGLQYFL